ncbi:MAG: aminotransferase class I/II-fold pyridoxal phosphate-dependent enzyme [candidate division Zixibacteria bacterium]|nr:aminotransferase class I/II-fold pyridoxal phosphate-dependent enzyme [candidate division Zixibacteria bacterium]
MKELDFHTLAVQGASPCDEHTGAVTTPIYQTSTFSYFTADRGAALFAKEEEGYIYTRLSNPTNEKLEKNLALLEGAEAGLTFASGLAAINALALYHCSAGDHFLVQKELYGGTYELFTKHFPRLGIDMTYLTEMTVETVRANVRDNTKLIFLETPSNPLMNVFDIAGIAEVGRKAGVPVAVDNTFATPYLTQPIKLGATYAVHSATKYIGGHGDSIGGMLAGPAEAMDAIRASTYKDLGATTSPFNAFLFLRGLKTLPLRMDRHCANAQKVAEFLAGHDKVQKVYYPGLPTHPGHELAERQMRLFGGMVGFDVAGFDAAKKLLDGLEVCVQAVSLGDVLTLIEHPASTTHHGYPEEDLADVGLTEGYVRISVGIEDAGDLIDDLAAGLERI